MEQLSDNDYLKKCITNAKFYLSEIEKILNDATPESLTVSKNENEEKKFYCDRCRAEIKIIYQTNKGIFCGRCYEF